MDMLEKRIAVLLEEFKQEYNCYDLNVKVIASNNLYEDKLRLASNRRRIEIERRKEWIQTMNGTVSEPDNLSDTFIVLINKEYIQSCKYNEWIGTLYHELTHVLDYVKLGKMLQTMNFKDIEEYVHGLAFLNWSEFNARRKGNYRLRCEMHGKDICSLEALNQLLQKELPYQMSTFVDGYQRAGNDGLIQIYCTMQFLGRLKVWKDLFPSYFTRSFIHDILGNNIWMEKMFCLLDANPEFEEIFLHFEEMENIFKGNFNFEGI